MDRQIDGRLLLQAYVVSYPLSQLGLESVHGHASPYVCRYGIVVVGTPASEAVPGQLTLVPEAVVHPARPTSLLPGPLTGMFITQSAMEVERLAGQECLVNHYGSLIHH